MTTESDRFDREVLRRRVLASLESQGFAVEADGSLLPNEFDKGAIRDLHSQACAARIEHAKSSLERHEPRLLDFFACGTEVRPERIRPILREVTAGSEEELLFRYARLHWSVPVSAGYGRRLRFLVFDDSNGKLIGLFGLGDPVFRLHARDAWIGWDHGRRLERLRHVMDAFVLGAVPPYSLLLCGKLIAMLVASDQVRAAFQRKYGSRTSMISERRFDGRLALITTASALGRSSLYNRIRYQGRTLYHNVGWTSGSGEFQFSNGVYDDLLAFAQRHCTPTAKHKLWGTGWRSRRELVRKVLPQLGLPRELVYHGVRRQIYVVPLAENAREFLRGETDQLEEYPASVTDLINWFRKRWLLPRATRDSRYRGFRPEVLRLWKEC